MTAASADPPRAVGNSVGITAKSPAGCAAELVHAERALAAFQAASVSANTRLAYQRDWTRFSGWCERLGQRSLPATPRTVSLYLAEAGEATKPSGQWAYSPATLARWVAGIGKAHTLAGFAPPGQHPDVEQTLAGIRRTHAQPTRRKAPLLLADVRTILAAMDHRTWPAAVASARDACLILMGFVGAFRRSEVAALNTAHVRTDSLDGLHVRIAAAKGDQDAQGVTIALPYGKQPETCPVCAWRRWATLMAAWDQAGPYTAGGRTAVMEAVLDGPRWPAQTHICRAAGATAMPAPEQPVCRAARSTGVIGLNRLSGHALNAMIKRRAATAGYATESLGYHSLRVGFVTELRRAGADARSIRLQTRHKSDSMIDVYDREYAPLAAGRNAVTWLDT